MQALFLCQEETLLQTFTRQELVKKLLEILEKGLTRAIFTLNQMPSYGIHKAMCTLIEDGTCLEFTDVNRKDIKIHFFRSYEEAPFDFRVYFYSNARGAKLVNYRFFDMMALIENGELFKYFQ